MSDKQRKEVILDLWTTPKPDDPVVTAYIPPNWQLDLLLTKGYESGVVKDGMQILEGLMRIYTPKLIKFPNV